MSKKIEKVYCTKCGAEINKDFAYCQYCGSINILGAEKEYMEKLEGVRQDLAEMVDDTEEEFKATVKTGSKFALKVFIMAIIAVAVIIGIVALVKKLEEKHDNEQYWKEKNLLVNYPELQELYDAKDYDGLVKYIEETDDPDFVIYTWEHYYFIQIYMNKQFLESDTARLNEYLTTGTGTQSDISSAKKWIAYDSLNLRRYAFDEDQTWLNLTEEEDVMVKEWGSHCEENLATYLGMTDSEIQEMLYYFDNFEENSYYSVNEVEDYLKDNGFIN